MQTYAQRSAWLDDIFQKQSKTLHSSFPVLRNEGGELFVSVFAAESPEGNPGALAYPTCYTLMDPVSLDGKYLFYCKDETNAHYKTFTDSPKDAEFPYTKTPSKEERLDAFSRFDNVLSAVRDDTNWQDEYAEYLRYIESFMSEALRGLYRALSGTKDEADKPGKLEQSGSTEETGPQTQDKAENAAPEEASTANTPENREATEEKQAELQPHEQAEVQSEQARQQGLEQEYSIQSVVWTPVHNLATLPQRYYNMLKKTASRIRFLPAPEANMIRFEYPIFCLPEDMSRDADKWLEVERINVRDGIALGHYRAMAGNSIYSMCKTGLERGCAFGRCVYLVAAYIKYLSENHKERLSEERREYKKNRFDNDAKFMDAPLFNLQPFDPVPFAKELWEGLAAVDENRVGVFSHPEDDTLLRVRFTDRDRSSDCVMDCSKAELETGFTQKGGFADVHGAYLPRAMTFAILADYLDRVGWPKEIRQDPAKEQGKRQAPGEGPTPTKPQINNAAKIPAKNEETDQPDAPSLQDFVSEDDAVYRCATASDVRGYYGCIFTDRRIGQSRAVKALRDALKDHHGILGATGISIHKVGQDTFADPYTLYCIHSISPDSLQQNQQALAALKSFHPSRHIVLVGAEKQLRAALDAHEALMQIYGLCLMIDRDSAVEAVAHFKELVPKRVADMLDEDAAGRLKAAVLSGKTIELLAWQSAALGKLVF